MPELPEVETITNDLKNTVIGSQILDFWTDSPKQIVGSVKDSVVDTKIVNVARRAKTIVLSIKNQVLSKYLVIHLKMTGRLLLRKQSDPPDKYVHAIFKLNNNRELRFSDTRKFGYVKIFKDEESLNASYKKHGLEPFSIEFTADHLYQKLKNKSVAIKTALLDQQVVSGVGNIYAGEALFLAKIKPDTKSKVLSYKVIKLLREKIIEVLKKGIKYRGSSSKDESYKDLFGELGQYQNHFLVYEKKGQACPNSCGGVIEYKRINGRGTFWCPRCQK